MLLMLGIPAKDGAIMRTRVFAAALRNAAINYELCFMSCHRFCSGVRKYGPIYYDCDLGGVWGKMGAKQAVTALCKC